MRDSYWPEIFGYTIAACVAMVIIGVMFRVKPNNPQDIWIAARQDKCDAMGGHENVMLTEDGTKFECWRHVFFSKQPTLLFMEVYAKPEVTPSKN